MHTLASSPQQSSNPVAKKYKSDLDKYGTPEQGFNVVCTTYRLTEHFHYWTQHQVGGRLNELQPGFFVEIPEALAVQKGIANGSRVKVISARGEIEGVAMVTKRLPTLKVDGKEVWQIGFPIHWGFAGAKAHTGPLANMLTPSASGRGVVQFSRRLTDAEFRRLAEWLRNYPDMFVRVYA